MSDNANPGFGPLVPGFDFLRNLARGASQAVPGLPNLSNWVAPTLSVEELDKRIGELRAVQFWLEQNGKALAATIQALEVQKMTLSTLQGMNLGMGELARALQVPAAGPAPATPPSPFAEAAAAAPARAAARKARTAAAQEAADARAGQKEDAAAPAAAPAAGAPGAVDPLAWWGSLTQQFQQIATQAMNELAAAPQPAAGGAGGDPASAAHPPQGSAPRAPRKAAGRKGRTSRGNS